MLRGHELALVPSYAELLKDLLLPLTTSDGTTTASTNPSFNLSSRLQAYTQKVSWGRQMKIFMVLMKVSKI